MPCMLLSGFFRGLVVFADSVGCSKKKDGGIEWLVGMCRTNLNTNELEILVASCMAIKIDL